MSSKYREMMKIKMEKEKIAAKKELINTEIENLLNRPIEDQPIDDMYIENGLHNLVGREITISAEKGNTSGRVEDVCGSGYKITFTIDGKTYPLFSENGNNIYNIREHATQDSVYENDHFTASIVEQIAFGLGMRYAREYALDMEIEYDKQEAELDEQESSLLCNSLGHNEGK